MPKLVNESTPMKKLGKLSLALEERHRDWQRICKDYSLLMQEYKDFQANVYRQLADRDRQIIDLQKQLQEVRDDR